MSQEQYLFIRILADFLSGKKTNPDTDVDWLKILQMAKIHQVQGIVYYQCKNLLPDNICKTLEEAYLSTTYYYINRKALMGEISRTFNQSELPFFCVKGYEVARYYPIPALRTMGDCDIVVHRKDVPKAAKLLQQRGYKGNETTTLQQWGCNKNRMHFEIHNKLVQEGEYATLAQIKFFNNYEQYFKDGIIDPSFHFMYLLMHLRKHFLNRGVGIRQFMDLAVMIMNNDQLNWCWIEDKLDYLDLLRFAHVCYALVENWFGVAAPVKYVRIDKAFVDQMTSKIIADGVFGFDNEENKKTDARTALIISKGPLWLRRIKMILQSVFLSYDIMRGYPGCGFIDGKPWLLPIAWIKRFVIIARERDKSSVANVLNNSMIPEDELHERKELLEKMGVL